MTNLAELDEYDVRRELARKTLDSLCVLTQGFDDKRLGSGEVATAVLALSDAVRGLVPASVAEVIDSLHEQASEAWLREPPRERWLKKGDEFIYIAVDESTGELIVRDGTLNRNIKTNPKAIGKGDPQEIALHIQSAAERRGFREIP